MAANNIPIVPNVLRDLTYVINNATGTTVSVAYTPTGTNGARIDSINITSTDTIAHDIQIYIQKSSVNYLLGTVPVPAGAGNSSTVAPVNVLLSSYMGAVVSDPYGNKVIWLDANATLAVGAAVSVTSGKQVTITGCAGEY